MDSDSSPTPSPPDANPNKRAKTTHQMQIKDTPSTSISTSRQESSAPSSPNPHLPQELILEILLMLPVKSLLKFKCVSRSWLVLISSPQFIRAHFRKSSSCPDYTHHRLIFTILPPKANLMQCDFDSVVNAPVTEVLEVDYPMKRPHKSVWVVGSVNGLSCVAIEEKDLFLWNPSTRKSKKLPNLNVRLRNGCYILYGFGYDEANDDYKVVGIFCVFRGGSVYETDVKVYSMRTDLWRRVEDFKGGIPLDDSGKYANGKLHWIASGSFGSSYNWKIVTFDLANDTYGEVERPNFGDNVCDWSFGELEGCLSVLCDYERNRVDLWVMKEYGVRDSWTKMVTVPYPAHPDDKLTYSAPLCILKNGEVLMVFGSVLVLYDPKQNSFRYPQLRIVDTCLEVGMYVESLVSPVIQDGAERQPQ